MKLEVYKAVSRPAMQYGSERCATKKRREYWNRMKKTKMLQGMRQAVIRIRSEHIRGIASATSRGGGWTATGMR